MPDMQFINDLFSQLFASKPEILLVLGIIAIGYALKAITQFPNRLIPLVNLLIGGLVYPLITSPGSADYTMRYPVVRQIICGLIIGCAAHYIHALVLKPRLDKYLPQTETNDPTRPGASLWIIGFLIGSVLLTGCTMGRGAFAGLNPFTWLKPSTYIEKHRQHEAEEVYRKSQLTNQTTQPK